MEVDRICRLQRKYYDPLGVDEPQLTAIMMMFFLLLDVLILDETYPPMLLVVKARRLRHETGNWALHARHEEWDVSLKELANKLYVS